MNKISIVFFDIDGTLLDNKTHQVCLRTKEALLTLKSNGIKVIIATGRSLEDLETLGIFDLIPWDGFICRNGADNYDQQSNLIERFHFHLDLSQKINEISLAKQIPLMISTGTNRYMNMKSDLNVLKSFDYFHKKIPALQTYQQEPVVMFLAFGQENYDYADFKIEGIQVLKGFSNFADIVIEGCSKYTGIVSVCKHLSIPLTETMAFGDALNDLEMIQGCTIGIAMGQGHPQLKAVADYITTEVDQDGIHHALNHFGLI